MKKLMTLEEATGELINSPTFIEKAKNKTDGAKYRVIRGRHKKGELKALAMIELLQDNGYEIFARKK